MTYSFAWQMAGGTGFNLIRDFSLTNTLRWTPNIQEGTYQIQVTARDYLANETSSTVVTFVVNPLVVGDPPVAVKTAHPLVALFSAPSCPTGSSMRIGFELNGSTQMNYTNFRTCHPPTSMNFYVAGMLAKSTYNMHYEVETGSTIVPDSNVVSFTTGAIPKSAPMATTSVVLPPTSQSAVSSDILFTGYTIEPYSAIDYPAATDLSGNVLWYFPGYGQITRMVTGNALLGTTILLDANGTGTGTGPFGNNVLQQVIEELDLAGNILRQTNADRISEQLVAMGTDPIGSFHHEVTRMPNGNTITFGSVQRIYPAGTQGPNPVDILGLMIIELDTNWQVIWYWNAFDHAGGGTQLDITRPATLGETCLADVIGCPPVLLSSPANDWLHANSAQYEPSDGSLLVSLRDQDWVIKIDFNNGNGTNNILWRLGLDGDFSINSSDPYPWFSGQHDVEFQYGTTQVMTVFDDGNTRVTQNPGEHSRCQVLNVDQTNLTASLLLNKDLGVYSVGLGSVQVLPNGNYTCNAAYVHPGSPIQQSVEVTPSATVAYRFQGQAPSYRAWRLPSLNDMALFTSVPPMTLACPSYKATVGTAYSSSLTATGGIPPYTFSITSGYLPKGLALNAATGAISGTPSVANTKQFTAQAVDSIGADTMTANCSIKVAP